MEKIIIIDTREDDTRKLVLIEREMHDGWYVVWVRGVRIGRFMRLTDARKAVGK